MTAWLGIGGGGGAGDRKWILDFQAAPVRGVGWGRVGTAEGSLNKAKEACGFQ